MERERPDEEFTDHDTQPDELTRGAGGWDRADDSGEYRERGCGATGESLRRDVTDDRWNMQVRWSSLPHYNGASLQFR